MAQREKQSGARRRPSQSTGPLRRKSCYFCKEKIEEVDYKNYNQLRRYVSEKGKIRSRRITGACRRHQEQIAVAVKRAREMALLPYVSGYGRMDVILLKDVEKVGLRGDVVVRLARVHAQLPRPAEARPGGDARARCRAREARRPAGPARGRRASRTRRRSPRHSARPSFAST